VTLVKDGDHRLSKPSDLKLLERTLDGLLEDASQKSAGPGIEEAPTRKMAFGE
jgi:hypothetical protein